jgi:hypothetical protein
MADFPVQPTAQDVVKFRSGDTVRVVTCWKANEVGEVVAAAWTMSDGTADHRALADDVLYPSECGAPLLAQEVSFLYMRNVYISYMIGFTRCMHSGRSKCTLANFTMSNHKLPRFSSEPL